MSKIHPAVGVIPDTPRPPGRLFVNFLDAYKEYTQNHEATEKVHTWTAISILAAALERKVWLEHGHYRIYPNLYTMIIGAPGLVKKSTATRIGVKLLRAVPAFKFAPERITMEAMIDAFVRSVDEYAIGPDKIKHCSMFAYASELTSFMNEQDKNLIDFLTTIYDTADEDYVRETRSHGKETIKFPCLNILACTTPNWIKRAIPHDQMEGGFASRFIFVIERSLPSKLVPFPGRTKELVELGKQLTQELFHINGLVGPMRMNQEAEDYFTEWYYEHMQEYEARQHISKFSGYLGRKNAHVEKLSMILSIAESDAMVLEIRHIKRAVAMLTELEKNFSFGLASGRNEDSDILIRVLSYIKARGEVDGASLHRDFFTDLDSEGMKRILEQLRQMGQIQQIVNGPNVKHAWIPGAPGLFAEDAPRIYSRGKRRSELVPREEPFPAPQAPASSPSGE